MSSFSVLTEESKIAKQLANNEERRVAREKWMAEQREKMTKDFIGKWGDVSSDDEEFIEPQLPDHLLSEKESEDEDEKEEPKEPVEVEQTPTTAPAADSNP